MPVLIPWIRPVSNISLLKHAKSFPVILSCGKYSQLPDKQENAVKYARLRHRQVIALEGRDASTFLQGIVTNDVTLLPEMKCMYAMVLNQHGRVLHDVMLYHYQQSDDAYAILMECEKESAESIMKTLKLYKLRKKLTITLKDDMHVIQAITASPLKRPILPHGNVIVSEMDPRVPLLGCRNLVENISGDTVDTLSDDAEYHLKRIQVGVPEGVTDLPLGNCLPLESNLDYMNGVSFHKGCYIGQELTARTKFTGVIRKRLVPITIEGKGEIEPGMTICTAKGKSAGKFRSMFPNGKNGLALIRLNYAEEKLTTKDGKHEVECSIPNWWPSKDGTDFSDGVCGPNVDENM